MYCMALKVYTCQEAASGTKTFLNIFCKLLQQKRTFPSLTVVLIPISTHPIVYIIYYKTKQITTNEERNYIVLAILLLKFVAFAFVCSIYCTH
jgi:hypothetical protein